MSKKDLQPNAKKSAKNQQSSMEIISSDTPLSFEQPTQGLGHEPALKELFIGCIKDIYWAEKHLVQSLPKMEAAATTEELKLAIVNHLSETEQHVARLEQIFELLGKPPQAKKCDAMEGLTKEGESIVEETEAGTATRDVGIVLAAQKVEHYEIATYGGLVQLATTLGLTDIASILNETLEEEKLADQKLTAIAEEHINYQATEEKA